MAKPRTSIAVPLSKAWPTVKTLLGRRTWFENPHRPEERRRFAADTWGGRRVFAVFGTRLTAQRPDYLPPFSPAEQLFVTPPTVINIFRILSTAPPIRITPIGENGLLQSEVWEAGPQGRVFNSGEFLVTYVPYRVETEEERAAKKRRRGTQQYIAEGDKVEILVPDFETLSLLFYEKGRYGHSGSAYRAARALAATTLGTVRTSDRFGLVIDDRDFTRRFNLLWRGQMPGDEKDVVDYTGKTSDEIKHWRETHIADVQQLLMRGSRDALLAEMGRWEERAERYGFGGIPRL